MVSNTYTLLIFLINSKGTLPLPRLLTWFKSRSNPVPLNYPIILDLKKKKKASLLFKNIPVDPVKSLGSPHITKQGSWLLPRRSQEGLGYQLLAIPACPAVPSPGTSLSKQALLQRQQLNPQRRSGQWDTAGVSVSGIG